MIKTGIVIMIKIEIGGIDIGRLRLQGKKIGRDLPVLVQRGKQKVLTICLTFTLIAGVIMTHFNIISVDRILVTHVTLAAFSLQSSCNNIFVYSKRTSGFDMAPPAGAVLPAATVSGLDLTTQSPVLSIKEFVALSIC